MVSNGNEIMEMKSWKECWLEEQINRSNINIDNICTFGIKPLDDALIGILPNDLIVLGADSGVGKSEISLNMALHNAMKGKKIALYFIEGGAEEAISRIKWNLIRHKYYEKGYTAIDMDYRKWKLNMLTEILLSDIE